MSLLFLHWHKRNIRLRDISFNLLGISIMFHSINTCSCKCSIAIWNLCPLHPHWILLLLRRVSASGLCAILIHPFIIPSYTLHILTSLHLYYSFSSRQSPRDGRLLRRIRNTWRHDNYWEPLEFFLALRYKKLMKSIPIQNPKNAKVKKLKATGSSWLQ